MTPTILSFGYQGQRLPDLVAYVATSHAVVADVRLKPFSRHPDWRRGVLARYLGDHYVWIEALGNLNYKGGGPVVLKDAEEGLATVRRLLHRHRVILMCACADAAICHRTVVAARLMAEGVIVRALDLAGEMRARDTRQPGLL